MEADVGVQGTHDVLEGQVEGQTNQSGALDGDRPDAFPGDVDVDDGDVVERGAVRREEVFDE